MNCEYVKSNAALLVYDELGDDARHELDQHIARCPDCAGEVKAVRDLQATMSLLEQPEPSPNLLAASRMRLQEALEGATQARGLGRFTFDFSHLLSQLRLAPAAAMALLIVGFAVGSLTTWKIARSTVTVQDAKGPRSGLGGGVLASISGIRSIDQVPGTDKVAIKYDEVSSGEATGSLADEKIQKLLLFAAHNNVNPGLRMDATNAMAQSPNDPQARESLIYSLRYDSNPGVRLKAIEAVGRFVKDDVKVRDAVLEALINDSSPGVRIEAVHALEPVRADATVRRVFTDLARSDQNQYIRRKAQEALNMTSAIE